MTLYRAGGPRCVSQRLFNSIEGTIIEGLPHDRNGSMARGGRKRLHAGSSTASRDQPAESPGTEWENVGSPGRRELLQAHQHSHVIISAF